MTIDAPEPGGDRYFLIKHQEHGLMLARWLPDADCFGAVGFSKHENAPFQVVAMRDEQIPLIEWHSVVL